MGAELTVHMPAPRTFSPHPAQLRLPNLQHPQEAGLGRSVSTPNDLFIQ